MDFLVLTGKTFLVAGVANRKSVAYHIGRTLEEAAAKVIYVVRDEEMRERLAAAKAALGERLVVPGHHYQRDEVMRFADFRGDSLQLSRVAAEQDQARYIVFCGVNFMAETAAMLSSPDQSVVLPAGDAACPMAQMADVDQAEEAWERLTALWGDEIETIERIDPVTGRAVEELDRLPVYPRTHYVTPREQLLQAIDGIRVELDDRLAELKRLAEERQVELWLSALSHRDDPDLDEVVRITGDEIACDCPDSRDHICKHQIAVRLYLNANP